jgi:hypothetical protein
MQPPPYVRFQSYSDYQISHQLPGLALNGADINADLDRIKATLDGTLGNLALIQRDDGKLRNQSVSPDSLSSAVVQMIADWIAYYKRTSQHPSRRVKKLNRPTRHHAAS